MSFGGNFAVNSVATKPSGLVLRFLALNILPTVGKETLLSSTMAFVDQPRLFCIICSGLAVTGCI